MATPYPSAPPKAPAPPPVAVEFHRLSLQAYEDLEKAVAYLPHAAADTTNIQAGFMLGVQHVLRHLRKGFVVGA